MKFVLNIDDEVFDKVIKDSLINDYYRLNDDISNYYERNVDTESADIPACDREDLIKTVKYRDALEIMLEYYLTPDEYKLKVLEQDD